MCCWSEHHINFYVKFLPSFRPFFIPLFLLFLFLPSFIHLSFIFTFKKIYLLQGVLAKYAGNNSVWKLNQPKGMGAFMPKAHLRSLKSQWKARFQTQPRMNLWEERHQEWLDETEGWTKRCWMLFTQEKPLLTPTYVKNLGQKWLWKISVFNLPTNASLGFLHSGDLSWAFI